MWKVEVIADNSGKWCGNAMTYESEEVAKKAAQQLFHSWTSVREWRVVPVEMFTCLITQSRRVTAQASGLGVTPAAAEAAARLAVSQRWEKMAADEMGEPDETQSP